MDFHRRTGARRVVSRPQPGGFVIENLAVAPGHQPFKDCGGEVQHAPVRTKIPGQGQKHAPFAPAVAPVFFQKQAGLRLAEAINGLLHVSHHEKIVPPGDPGENGLLNVGRVLIFVHKHIGISLPGRVGHRLLFQRPQGALFQVGIRQRPPLRLGDFHQPHGLPGDLAQHPGRLQGVLRVRKRHRQGKPRHGQGVHAPLGHFPQGFRLVNGLRGKAGVPALGRDKFEIRQRLPQRFIILNFQQLRQRLRVRRQRGLVMPGQFVHALAGLRHVQIRLLYGAPVGLQHLPHPGLGSAAQRLFQPCLRVRPGFQKANQLRRHFPHPRGPPAVIQLFQGLAPLGIHRFQGLVQGLFLNHGRVGLVQDGEGRVHTGGFEILPQEIRAEGVEGGNQRPFQPKLLLMGPGVSLGCQRTQGPGKLFPHARGGGSGKGDHQKGIHVRPFRYQPQNAFHQRGGFSGTRGGAEQQVAAPFFNGGPLFVRKAHGQNPPIF